MHVNRNAGLQVGSLNLGQLTTQSDHDHFTQDGLCLLHVLGHDRLVCPSQRQSRLSAQQRLFGTKVQHLKVMYAAALT